VIPSAVRELAEDPTAYTPLPPGFERILDDRYCLLLGPSAQMTLAQRLRLGSAPVEEIVAEVRALAADRGRSWLTWWVTDSTTPADLEERLSSFGMQPAAMPINEPSYEAMALTRPPRAAGGEVTARLAADFDEFRVASEIGWETFGMTQEQRQVQEELLPMFFELHRAGVAASYLCLLDGRPVAAALAVFADAAVMLLGGAVLPEARGRGCYRALVRARWDDGVARGTPALVVQAGAMSQPILERLGFERVATMHVLVDRFG
jgi:GNAT superfamily N-acetyltransferase